MRDQAGQSKRKLQKHSRVRRHRSAAVTHEHAAHRLLFVTGPGRIDGKAAGTETAPHRSAQVNPVSLWHRGEAPSGHETHLFDDVTSGLPHMRELFLRNADRRPFDSLGLTLSQRL